MCVVASRFRLLASGFPLPASRFPLKLSAINPEVKLRAGSSEAASCDGGLEAGSGKLHGLDQLDLERVRGRRGPAGQIELREDVAHVARDGFVADTELVGDGAVALAVGDEPQDLKLPRREPPGRWPFRRR